MTRLQSDPNCRDKKRKNQSGTTKLTRLRSVRDTVCSASYTVGWDENLIDYTFETLKAYTSNELWRLTPKPSKSKRRADQKVNYGDLEILMFLLPSDYNVIT